jgi:hypothetical protein
MGQLKRYGKLILFDTLAILCFIGVILFGWLPGPGGVPLFLAGLALLAVNHDWAERWLETAKHKGKSFKKILFPPNQWIRLAYDVGSIAVFSFGTYAFFASEQRIMASAGLALAAFALFVFLINRDRLDKLSGIIIGKKHKHIK